MGPGERETRALVTPGSPGGDTQSVGSFAAEFECVDGSRTLDAIAQCNTDRDCDDGSDELPTPPANCDVTGE